ncbi:gamma-glutamyltransferase, partial [Yersinia pestis PY-15]
MLWQYWRGGGVFDI